MPSTASSQWTAGPDDISFFTKTWTPDQPRKAKVVFIHGFIEHITRYDHVFRQYADAGIEVFAFDQRGFGETGAKGKTKRGVTSWDDQFKDIDFFVKQEASNVHEKVFLMGHSMGGALCFGYHTRYPTQPSASLITGGAIVTSPLIEQTPSVATSGAIIRVGSFVGLIFPKMTLKVQVNPKDVSRDPAVQKAYASDPLCAPIGSYKGVGDMILGGRRLLTSDYRQYPQHLPFLAVHGTGDNVTYCRATEELHDQIKADDKTFIPFEGGFHELHNDIEPTQSQQIKTIIDWILSKS